MSLRRNHELLTSAQATVYGLLPSQHAQLGPSCEITGQLGMGCAWVAEMGPMHYVWQTSPVSWKFSRERREVKFLRLYL